jgi:hypothetical protein
MKPNAFTRKAWRWIIRQVLLAKRPRWYKGDGQRYGKVKYFHLPDMVIRIKEDRL